MYYKSEEDSFPELYSGAGSYSDELKQLIINLATAKTYIYDYYYRLCLDAKSLDGLKNALNRLNKLYSFDHDIAKLVCMVGFDKVEKQRIGTYHPLESNEYYRKTNPNHLILKNIIRTSRRTIYEPFFNYLLLGYEIV
jgi:hypothetical protein